jgi:hypothetical protein
VAALLQVIAALLSSHAGAIWRHARRIAALGAAFLFAVLVGVIYFLILLTNILSLLVGTTVALAIMTVLAGFVCVLFVVAMRRERRNLVAAHRQHVEEERLALRAAGIEAAEASKLSGSIAAVSASLAAVIVLILRRLGPGEEPTREEAAGEEQPPGA